MAATGASSSRESRRISGQRGAGVSVGDLLRPPEPFDVLRFGLEFLREDIASRWLGIGFYQWLSLGLCSVGVYQIVIRTRKIRAGNYREQRGLMIEPSQVSA